MKAKFSIFFFLLISVNAYSSALNVFRDLYETTYSRDNSFCHFNNYHFELQIRSLDMYSQPNDRDYGEYPFILQNKIKYKVDFNQDIGRYRLIYAKERECSKSLSMPLNKDEITLFFAHDNRPYADLLVLIHYNPQARTARIIHTQEPIINYYQLKDKVFFSSYYAKTTMSTTDFNGASYTLLQSMLPQWKSYADNRISVEPEMTFKQFEWKPFFKDLAEFKSNFAWNEASQVFNKDSYQLIFNYQLKKRCLRVLQEWRCLAI